MIRVPAFPVAPRRQAVEGTNAGNTGSDADVKTDVEELSPTRVKLSVEVPFDELKPSIDKAYREVARQVRIPGFRPGRVPPRIIDQRIGRGPVLEQAVNDAIPELYGKAVEESELFALGRPEVEITSLDDGKELSFTAEVDVRPKFELPSLASISVTIDNATVTPDDVEEYLSSLRERFASLKGVQRPAESGDFVSIDLSATVDGEPVEDAQASGLSYEVGSGSMLEGLDDAVTAMTAGESKTFSSELAGGENAGDQAEVTVTVHSVKVKELPDFDDDFAQLASEFDTIGELRADTRQRLEGMRRQQQAIQARDRALDALLDQVEVPLPDSIVAEEAHRLEHSMRDQIQRAGADWGSYLQMVGKTEDEFNTDLQEQSRRSVKVGLVLDQVARQEDLGVDDAEFSWFVTQQAQQMGVEPEVLARQIAEGGQIGAAVAEVVRGKAMALLASRVKIQDEAGRELDYATLIGQDADDATTATDATDDDATDDDATGDGDTSADATADVGTSAGDTPAGDSAAGDSAGEDDAAPVATGAEAPATEAPAVTTAAEPSVEAEAGTTPAAEAGAKDTDADTTGAGNEGTRA